jgi:hypothetical protein
MAIESAEMQGGAGMEKIASTKTYHQKGTPKHWKT